MAQSATLHFSPAAWAAADNHRSGTSARNPTTLRQRACRLCQIHERGSLVALESRTCARFKLHRSAPKRVLDLGCGGGFFLFILKGLGHSVLGLDVGRVSLFTELLDLFDVPRVVWRIEAFKPLPDLGEKFDWITAFSVNFNLYHPSQRRWVAAEWDFLLRDLQRHLASGGKIFFGLNPLYAGDYYTPELHDFFLSRGANVERERIFFDKGLRF